MTRRTVTAVTALLISSACANAGIIGWQAADDGDGGIVCTPNSWQGPSAESVTIAMTGDLNFAPAHIVGTVTADSPNDPMVTFQNSIDNSTFAAWTAMQVNISMNQTFTISDAVVNAPADWLASITQPTLVGSQYLGTILYNAGTPINIGSSIDFKYTVSFAGSMSFTQEFIPSPVPEPASSGCSGSSGLWPCAVATASRPLAPATHLCRGP